MMAGWQFSETDLADARNGSRLLNPSIDLGVVCDLNCPYCFTETVTGKRRLRRPNELDMAETFSVLEDFVTAGARSVNIVGAGEPLLHPSLRSVVSYLEKAGVVTVIFTNGTRLADNPGLVKFLYEHAVTVVVKVNSRNAALQDAVAGRRGYTTRRDRALQELIAAGFAGTDPTRLAIDTMAFAGNLAELPEIHRWCRSANVCPLTSDFIPSGRTTCGGIARNDSESDIEPELAEIANRALVALSPTQRVDLVDALSKIDDELGISGTSARAYYGGGACTQILGVYVDVEGAIWPCVARTRLLGPSREPLGRVRDGQRASELWRQSDYMAWIRQSYTGGCPYKAPLCRSRSTSDASHTGHA